VQSLEPTSWGEYGGLVLTGLITLALVGMFQGLGLLAEPEVIGQAWRSDPTGEDDRHDGLGLWSPTAEAVSAGALTSARRIDFACGLVDDETSSPSRLRLRARESRGPPVVRALQSR